MRIQGKSALAEYFEVSRTTIDAWVRRGCPYLSGGPGKPWTFDSEDVEDWLADRDIGQSPEEDAEKQIVRAFAAGVGFQVARAMIQKYDLKLSDDETFSIITNLFNTDRDLRALMRTTTRAIKKR